MNQVEQVTNQMNTAIVGLCDAYQQAQAKVAGGFWQDVGSFVLGNSNSVDAVKHALDEDAERIADLDSARNDVLSGKRSYADWYSSAKTISEDIAYQSGLPENWTAGAYVDFTAVNTVETVNAAIDDHKGAITIAIAGGVLVLVLLVLIR